VALWPAPQPIAPRSLETCEAGLVKVSPRDELDLKLLKSTKCHSHPSALHHPLQALQQPRSTNSQRKSSIMKTFLTLLAPRRVSCDKAAKSFPS
jgi:hypothetical protein